MYITAQREREKGAIVTSEETIMSLLTCPEFQLAMLPTPTTTRATTFHQLHHMEVTRGNRPQSVEFRYPKIGRSEF